jgi:DNA (cytosine-5)-methyltransferase 1
LRVLDLFCGQGGVAEGLLALPGIDQVIGADVDPKAEKYYPAVFNCVDWKEAVDRFAHEVNFIWASPPCQAFTGQYAINGKPLQSSKLKLIRPVRERLLETGLPFVIENVSGAMRENHGPDEGLLSYSVKLSGEMFSLADWFEPTWDNPNYGIRKACSSRYYCGEWPERVKLKLHRPRFFEAHGFTINSAEPDPCLRKVPSLTIINGSDTAGFHRLGHRDPRADEAMRLFGIKHQMSKHGVAESIPPAYAKYVGEQFLQEAST